MRGKRFARRDVVRGNQDYGSQWGDLFYGCGHLESVNVGHVVVSHNDVESFS